MARRFTATENPPRQTAPSNTFQVSYALCELDARKRKDKITEEEKEEEEALLDRR